MWGVNKMSDIYEDLGFQAPSQRNKSQESEPGSPLYKQILDALGGGIVGGAQGLSDIGANIAQAPSDAYTWLTGKEGYNAPKPDIREYAPSSSMGKAGESIGEFASPFASPGLAAETMLMRGGSLLPRILAGMASGAAQSENRKLGAGLGAAFPAAGAALRTPKTLNAATRRLEQARDMARHAEPLNFRPSNQLLNDIEHQFGERTLAPSRRHIETSLIDLLNGNYEPYFTFQADLGTIARELQHPESNGFMGIKQALFPPQTSAVERLTGREVGNLRQRLLDEMANHLQENGFGQIATRERLGRRDFADYQNFKKLRKSALYGLAGATIAGTPAYHFLKSFM